MRIAIVEDNKTEANLFEDQLLKCLPDAIKFSAIDKYGSGEDFLNTKQLYDLAFIDCQLPGMSGVDLGKEMLKRYPPMAICYVTAFMEYAVEGYETNAFRYLLKPVSDEKLTDTLYHFVRNLLNDKYLELTGSSKSPVYAKISEIWYVEASLHRTVVRLKNESITSRLQLIYFEKELDSIEFFKAHRHFLVNLNYIEKLDGNTIFMKNGERIEISYRRRPAFAEAYKEFIKRTG